MGLVQRIHDPGSSDSMYDIGKLSKTGTGVVPEVARLRHCAAHVPLLDN